MTIATSGGAPRPRSKRNRQARAAGRRASVTLFAGALCLLFIMPLIYMFSTVFNASDTIITAGAPLYPALGRAYTCPNEALCSYHDGFVSQKVTWGTAPTLGTAASPPRPVVATVASTEAGKQSTVDVSKAVTTKGPVSLAVTTTSDVSFASKESSTSANRPQLVVTTYAVPTDSEAPSTPAGVTATPKSATEIDLEWTPSTDNAAVAAYRVYRDNALLVTVGSPSWNDTGLSAASAHTYSVTAIDASGNSSGGSPVVSATSLTDTAPDSSKPTAPTDVTVTSSASMSATVSWTASTDNVSVVSYTITRDPKFDSKVASDNLIKVSGSTTSFVDHTVIPATTYKYTITAADAALNASDGSKVGSVTTPSGSAPAADTTKPSVPGALSASVKSATEIDLSWTASTDNVAVAAYHVYKDGSVFATVGSTNWRDTVSAGSSHNYQIAAVDAAGNESDKNAQVTKSLADTTAPSVPGTLTVTSTSWNSTKLTWTASTDNVAVTSYSIARDGTDISLVSGATTSFVDATAKPWTAYSYTVTALDAAGNKAPSTAATITTPGPTAAEAAPVNTTLSPVMDSYVDEANASTGYGDKDVLLASGASGAAKKIYIRFDLSQAPAGIVHGATLVLYSNKASSGYSVEAVSDILWSETTKWIDYPAFSYAGTLKPLAPTGVKAAWNADASAVAVSWTQATDKAAVGSYTVVRTTNPNDGTAPVRTLVSGDASSFNDVTTLPDSGYTYTVLAADRAGTRSDTPAAVNVTTPTATDYPDITTDTLAPTAPAGLAATVKSGTEIDLSWTAATDNVAVSGYRVYRDGSIIASTGSTSWFDTTVDPNTTHIYQVTALDEKLAESVKPASVNATTLNQPLADVAAGDGIWKGNILPIFIVPMNKLMIQNPPTDGSTVDLALFVDKNPDTLQSVQFIDPVSNKVVLSKGPLGSTELSRHWDFHITLDNFSTAAGWADKITSGAVTDSSLGGQLIGGGFLRFFFNTLIIAGLGTIGATLSAIVVAFGFARFKIPGRDALFMVLIGTILLPFQVTLIPQFVVFTAIGWAGTWLPLIVPHYFANAYNVFLLRQYFLTLPRELDEAAMMDGATPFRILVSVIIPQSWPAIISVVLFHFFFAWNDFLSPLVYLSGKPDLYPISIGLSYFNTTFRVNNAPPAIQAGALLSLILPVAIFFVAQQVFMRGVVISGVEK
jgi:ABC-type glycerol-3-phosphate transport system permease component/chitodextrinase